MEEMNKEKAITIKINLSIIKKLIPFGLFAIGFIIGLGVMYLFLQPKLSYQRKSVMEWAITASNNQKDANVYKERLASVSGQMNALLEKPTPTPAVRYIDNTPSHPDFSTCTREGDFYYCSSDGCYYTQSGKQGSCKIPGW